MTLTEFQLEQIAEVANAGKPHLVAPSELKELVAVYRAALAWERDRKVCSYNSDRALVAALKGPP